MDILFYKLIKSGLHGRVINTLRNLYTKTYFRVKQGGYLSDLILQEVGVNQGGNASPIIFRKCLADLRNYLNENTGVILSEDEILVHLLWADDLILTSTTTADAQNQLNGLSKYCSKHKSIVNSVKTKFMVYGKLENVRLYFNGNALEQVTEYEYLGNIVTSRSIGRPVIYSQRITNTSVIKPVEVSSQFLKRQIILEPYQWDSELWQLGATRTYIWMRHMGH